MKSIISFFALLSLGNCGVITHDDHGKATSYQSIHMEHFHPIPTFIKGEHKHLLEHPISIGKSSSKVEVHHGDKHHIGYGITSVHNTVHGHGHGGDLREISVGGGGDYQAYQGHEEDGGAEHALALASHEGAAQAGYAVQDQGHDISHYLSQLVHAHGSLGQASQDQAHYQLAEQGGEEQEHQASNNYETYAESEVEEDKE